jgi:hypothetical protein
VQDQIRAIQAEALNQLRGLQEQLYRLFVSSDQVQQSLHLPIPVQVVGQAAQQGGVMHAQMGRMVPAMLEPGELVYPGPLSRSTMRALETVNHAFPRFQVRGYGSGDTVPTAVPEGSFILNRRASRVVQGGYQTGGVVQGSNGSPPVITNHFHFDLRGAQVRSDEDIRKLADELERRYERITRSQFRGRRGFPS